MDRQFVEKQKKRILRRLTRYKRKIQEDPDSLYAQHKEKRIITNLEIAFKQIQKGEYGLCIDCGDEIDIKRLEQVPGAIRCLECQENEEKNATRTRS